MIMLRSTHEHQMSVIRRDMDKLKEDYMVLNDELYEVNQVARSLENRNCQLSTKLTVSETKANEYKEKYDTLSLVHKETKKELEEVKEKNTKLLNDVALLGKVYNNMNRKLWANHEAQRQLRKLSEDMLEADKINKNEVSNYIYQLTNLIGGGEEFVFMGMKEAMELEAEKNGAANEKA